MTSAALIHSTDECSAALFVAITGGPVGLETLAATINEDSVTLEDVYEPYLLQQGFLAPAPPDAV